MDQLESEHYRLPYALAAPRISVTCEMMAMLLLVQNISVLMEINRLDLESGMREERARALRLEQSTFALRSSLWAAVLSFRVSNGRRALEPFLVVWRTR